MAAVSGTSLTNNGAAQSDQVKGAVNLSDAAKMENTFISLMVAQIQNQDPTSPVDNTEFLNQFSAMSQVKSLENMAALSQSNLVLLDNLQTLTAAGLVNQEVKVAVESLSLDGEPVKGSFNLEHASAKTQLELTDSNGVVTRVELGSQAPGDVPFTIDPAALGLRPGTFKVAVVTASGELPTVEVAGVVTRVRVGDSGPMLDIDGVGSVPFYTLTEFGQSRTAGLF
ncbi:MULTISPECIES: flagellar hook capping FlgD N-terminal domain-containing protein [unclassified Pseudomonas]|uniref:flagellar hook capping FlgD N-terminal domain-containing protein n=1 Tax=unclassified Pseudomonas TaxID=196821 RepID=UPI00047F6DCD|nr:MULTISPECIES: flagellar hook capping FlgD N-terminal domain-containing protein [unclassified Pseudomonas]MBV7564378.1 flagellar hook assembly protein FlgD [Pseudomonas sp. sia0905]PZW69705.1 flagellar basal-body rod modification protein FlgD [Pseudomonas sp. URMO17WK12:I1]